MPGVIVPSESALETLWTPDTLESPHAAPDKARRVRRMFDAIAPRYELVNSVFSVGRDAYWRRKAVELAKPTHGDDVLDVACGTGDFARAFAAAGVRSVTGCDFAHGMLVRASGAGLSEARVTATSSSTGPQWAIQWCEADAQGLPFAAECVSIVSCAFGVRNFQDLDRGLQEMRRVLRPGGRAVILEFSRPSNRMLRLAYEFYACRIMPIAASWLSGDRSGAYRYLPRSVVSFLTAGEMCDRLREAGFQRVQAKPLTFGTVTVYLAHSS